MPTTIGPNPGGTFATDNSVGSADWANPGFAVSENASSAAVVLGPSAISYYLKVTNFGFAVPDFDRPLGVGRRFIAAVFFVVDLGHEIADQGMPGIDIETRVDMGGAVGEIALVMGLV